MKLSIDERYHCSESECTRFAYIEFDVGFCEFRLCKEHAKELKDKLLKFNLED